MRALIFRETGEPKSVLKLAEIPTRPLAPGEALVRVLLSPINASDLHMVRGRYGYQRASIARYGCGGRGWQSETPTLSKKGGTALATRRNPARTSMRIAARIRLWPLMLPGHASVA